MSKTKSAGFAIPVSRISVFLGVAAFFLYLASTGYTYTADDNIFFLNHKSVQKGLKGTGEIFSHGSMEMFDGTKGAQTYRPVTLMAFAIEKQFFGVQSVVSHLINVLLYVLLTLILFKLLMQLFKVLHPVVAGIITLLFIVHPLHTEVVASVKSRDELLAGILCFSAWRHYLKYLDGKGKFPFLLSLLLFALASFTKESSVAFIAVLPLSAILFRKTPLGRALLSALPFAAISAGYLAIRFAITGTENAYYGLPILTNILTATNGFNETMATKLEILWYHLKLVVVPWPLSWDYSFNQIPIVTFSNFLPWLSLLAYAGLLLLAFLQFRKQPVLSFSILFFLILSAPVNNFFIKNVTTFGERLLFIPSLGMCIATVWLIGKVSKVDLQHLTASGRSRFFQITTSAILLFTVLTAVRAGDWKDNLTLFRTGVETCPNSSRTQASLATELVGNALRISDPLVRADLLKEAREHFEKSVEILPQNYQAHYNYGVYCANIGDTAGAIKHYEAVIKYQADSWEAMNNLAVIYANQSDFITSGKFYRMAYATAPNEALTISNMASHYFLYAQYLGSHGQVDSAISNYRSGLIFQPEQPAAYTAIAELFKSRSQYDSAEFYLKQCLTLNSSDLATLESLADISFLNKQYDQSIAYAERALQLNGNLPNSLSLMVKCYTALGQKEKAAAFKQRLEQPSGFFTQ